MTTRKNPKDIIKYIGEFLANGIKKLKRFENYYGRLLETAIVLVMLIIIVKVSGSEWASGVKAPVEDETVDISSVSQIRVQSENSYKPEESLRSQLIDLVELVAEELDMDKKQVSVIFDLSDTPVIYDNAKINIYEEETSYDEAAPLKIASANTILKEAEFAETSSLSINRPSSRYLPDALYSVASDLKELTEERHEINSDSESVYYNSLNDETENIIDFDEAVLSYIGEDEDRVDSFKDVYEKILTDKEANENVVEIVSGNIAIKDKFREILTEANITDENAIRLLGILFSKDKTLFKNDNIDKLTDAYVYPYEIGLTSRENMMTAAMSLVGDVRYVWGGGHSGAAYIKGINPVWKQFNRLYPSEPFTDTASGNSPDYNVGFGTCIKPSGSWCPIHGYVNSAFHGETIYSLDQYIKLRSGLFNKIDLTDDKYREMLSTVNYSNGVNAHVLDGLDCSGYVSWLYNQIQNKYDVNTAARYFTRQSCFTPLEMGADLLPGDIFAWESHIVVIVGRVKEGSGAYVTLEETPNVLRFGVAYYTGASDSDISYGKQIASEANSLIGGLNPSYEKPHVYCINTVGASESANTVVQTAFKVSSTEEGYCDKYDTLINGEPYKIVRVYMPRGYEGTAQDLGAPEEGDYESVEIDEKEEGFYGTYYVKVSKKKAGHSCDEKKDGFLVRHIYMPRDYDGSMEELGVPDDSIVERKDVIEEDDGFYATYYTDPNKSVSDDEDEEKNNYYVASGSTHALHGCTYADGGKED